MHESAKVLSRLVRFKTVNPPGAERECQEWLRDYLEGAGFECELLGAEEERPNLVATLRGEEPGPVLGFLSHVDTVLADADAWRRDPWGGEVHDGELWGRGALDMKSQTAAEAVAGATLARSGWRPRRGALKIFSVVDEEVGGLLGAQWLTQNHPDAARCDFLLNEGGGAVMPYGERRLYGVCCAEKGTFRFIVRASGVAGHASLPGIGENALLKLGPVLDRMAAAQPEFDITDEPRELLRALGEDPDDPARAIAAVREVEPRLAVMIEPTLRVTAVPTIASASEKINVIPARAELRVDCRVPPGLGANVTMARIHEYLGDAAEAVEIEFTEQVVGNRSPIETPLMDAIRGWVGARDAGAEAVPVVLPAFTDSRTWRDAFPDCVAYGFFPHRHASLYETWPLIHANDERIDLRDLEYATDFFEYVAKEMLS